MHHWGMFLDNMSSYTCIYIDNASFTTVYTDFSDLSSISIKLTICVSGKRMGTTLQNTPHHTAIIL